MSTYPLQTGTNIGLYYGGVHLAGANGQVSCRGGGVNTWGAWQEIEASTPYAATEFVLQLQRRNATLAIIRVQIALGASGNEAALIELPTSSATFFGGAEILTTDLRIPLQIPAGSRVAARIMLSIANTAQDWVSINFIPLPAGPLQPTGFRGVEALNFGGSGAAIDTIFLRSTDNAVPAPAGTITEISSGIVNHWRAFSLVYGGDGVLASATAFQWRLRAGSGSGDVIFGTMASVQHARAQFSANHGPFPCNIPAGTRLLLEFIESITTSSNDNIFPVLYGWY